MLPEPSPPSEPSPAELTEPPPAPVVESGKHSDRPVHGTSDVHLPQWSAEEGRHNTDTLHPHFDNVVICFVVNTFSSIYIFNIFFFFVVTAFLLSCSLVFHIFCVLIIIIIIIIMVNLTHIQKYISFCIDSFQVHWLCLSPALCFLLLSPALPCVEISSDTVINTDRSYNSVLIFLIIFLSIYTGCVMSGVLWYSVCTSL